MTAPPVTAAVLRQLDSSLGVVPLPGSAPPPEEWEVLAELAMCRAGVLPKSPDKLSQVAAQVWAYFRNVCVKAGFDRQTTTGEMLESIEGGLRDYNSHAYPNLTRFLPVARLLVEIYEPLVARKLPELASHRFFERLAGLPKDEPFDWAALGANSPSLPPSRPDLKQKTAGWSRRRILGWTLAGVAVVGAAMLGRELYLDRVDREFLEENRPLLQAAAKRLDGPARAMDRAMADRGFTHDGIPDKDWQ